MNPNEITCLSQLNLAFHCFEPEPISIPLTQEEKDEQEYRRMCLDDAKYEAEMERHDYMAEFGESHLDNYNDDYED